MTRYTFGGDEQILAIFSDEMSLKACFRGFHLADVIRSRKISGITEICAGNVALMLRFDPDIIAPDILMNELEQLDSTLSAEEGSFETRVIEVPVLYGDPWTHETLMRFRDRHQNPELTDLSYAAAINGYPNVAAFIKAHTSAPWITSMVGFVAGLPFLYQMVEQEQQIQVPKYLRPRTDTPALSIGHGGCFGSIYPVRGAGGYQLLGITPMPIFDSDAALSYMQGQYTFCRPGDIICFRAIERPEYDAIREAVSHDRFTPRIRSVSLSISAFLENPTAITRMLTEALHGD